MGATYLVPPVMVGIEITPRGMLISPSTQRGLWPQPAVLCSGFTA
jgi:hypothetical protein